MPICIPCQQQTVLNMISYFSKVIYPWQRCSATRCNVNLLMAWLICIKLIETLRFCWHLWIQSVLLTFTRIDCFLTERRAEDDDERVHRKPVRVEWRRELPPLHAARCLPVNPQPANRIRAVSGRCLSVNSQPANRIWAVSGGGGGLLCTISFSNSNFCFARDIQVYTIRILSLYWPLLTLFF